MTFFQTSDGGRGAEAGDQGVQVVGVGGTGGLDLDSGASEVIRRTVKAIIMLLMLARLL